VSHTLLVIRNEPARVNRLLELLDPLAEYLERCRLRGADTARSPALGRLESEISKRVVAAVAGLSPEASPARIAQFVDELTLGLRLRVVATRALGTAPEWMALVSRALARDVFGIVDPLRNRTLYWSAALTARRAQFLVKLDPPLRAVLSQYASEADAQAFFEQVMVPLARVHGFLRVLHESGTETSPLRQWVTLAPQPQLHLQRIEQVFAALDTDRWVDADDPLLDLAKLALSLSRPSQSIWSVPPSEVFAGHWSVNANVRLYYRLLSATPPDLESDTRAIAARIIDELGRDRLAEGPRFAPAGERIPASDHHESIWRYAVWIDNLVTAAEWRQFLFRDAKGTALPIGDRLRITSTNGPDLAFEFKLLGNEVSRTVNGDLRLRMARIFLSRVDPAAPRSLFDVARMSVLLPNHTDNALPSGLAPARQLRQQIYTQLGRTASRAGTPDRLEAVRWMMRLHVAQRAGPTLRPAFDGVVAGLMNAEETAEAARDIRSEQAALESVLKGTPQASLSFAREFIDGQVNALLPPGWTAVGRDAMGPRFARRLATLNDARVLRFIQVRQQLQTLARALAERSRDARSMPADAATLADVQRIERSLDLLDSHVWFSRPDFDADAYLDLSLPNDSPGTSGVREWWPALVVLASHKSELQVDVLRAIASASSTSAAVPGPAGGVVRRLVQLDETMFSVMLEIAKRANASDMLAFEHQIVSRELNLRLLVFAETPEIVSAATLARDAFAGVGLSRQLAMIGRKPSDEDLWQRLFGSMDYLMPEEDRRIRSLDVSFDRAVRIADEWSRATRLPRPLRDAATAFIAGHEEASRSLLAGAATTAGVLRAFDEVLRLTAAAPQTGYTQFYTRALTTGKSLSPGFRRALETPFFAGPIDSQVRSVEEMLADWAGHSRGDTSLVKSYRADFGNVLRRLVRGDNRPPGAVSIWDPVAALLAESGIRQTKPAGFLHVVQWLYGLKRRFRDPELWPLFGEGTR
jgi:hypothetical protein